MVLGAETRSAHLTDEVTVGEVIGCVAFQPIDCVTGVVTMEAFVRSVLAMGVLVVPQLCLAGT